jgi:hypothetical protein
MSLRGALAATKQSPVRGDIVPFGDCFLSPVAGRCTGMLRNRNVRSQRHAVAGAVVETQAVETTVREP